MADVLQSIEQELGPGAVIVGEEVATRDIGWGRDAPCEARAVVRPANTGEVSTVMRLCHAAGQPVVVQGGMTGLVDGAVPTPDEIALSLERLNAIEDLDVVGRTMTVQCGVPLQAIQERARDNDLLFPLDMGARGSCTIGGNVSTNAGGNRVIRYGMTRALVLGLEAVLADGTVITSLNQMIKNNAAYDLKHLFIGSEGTLGIVTRVVVRLWPAPRSHDAALVAVSDLGKVTRLLSTVDAGLGGTLSAFEVMWEDFYRLVTMPPAKGKPVLPHGSPYYVLLDALGADPEADADRFQRVLGECMELGLLTDAAVAQSNPEREALWSLRDDVEQLFQMNPVFVFDVSLAIGEIESYIQEVRDGLAGPWPDHRCVVFGHMGDGNLHIAVSVGSEDPTDKRKVEQLVYGPLEPRHGSVSAEHGIGLEKQPYLHLSRTPEELTLMRTLKQTLDPKQILNRHRVLPELPGSDPRK
jgi:FAD/FMN-containing dehydrogenase